MYGIVIKHKAQNHQIRKKELAVMIICEKCGNKYPGYYIINTSNETEGYEQLYFECFNKIMADQLGIKL